MSSASILALFCGTILLTVGILGIGYLIVTSRKPKQGTVTVSSQPTQNGFKSWVAPIIIAIVLGFWNASLSIVYLLIVWVIRLNPKKELAHIVTDDTKKICEKNIKWLRNSSFITIPIFLIALNVGAHPFIAAFLPFVFHLALIGRLQTENLYIYRHTQQALFLLLIRAGTTIAIFSYFYLDGFLVFVIVNGALWLFGANWEIKQIKTNDCWLMRRRGEEINVPQIPVDADQPVELDKATTDMLKNATTKEKKAGVKKSIKVFRTGTRQERKKAVLVLAELGEVEKF
ncbi:MAG TPA: hypothetical protein VLA72_17875 [Anaerolineales bacterium]|nr:hypothetical protein [Anaerolineales bacterium]